MQSSDGKFYKTDVADTEQLFRLVQSIPSLKQNHLKCAARLQLEKTTGKKLVTKLNARNPDNPMLKAGNDEK